MRREIILQARTHVWEFLRSSSLATNLKFAIWQTNIIIDIDGFVACVSLFNHYQSKKEEAEAEYINLHATAVSEIAKSTKLWQLKGSIQRRTTTHFKDGFYH